MASPAGPCEWCGGPQWWTVVAGVMYVKCQGGCVSLFSDERVNFPPPSDVADPFYEGGALQDLQSRAADGTLREEGVEPPEGGDAKTSANRFTDDLPF